MLALYNANLSQQLGVSPQLMTALAVLTATLGSVPGQPFADTYLRLATAMFPEIDDLPFKAWAALFMGMYLLETGRWTDSFRLLEKGVGFSDEIGYRRNWEENWGLTATLLYHWGKFSEASQRCEGVYASANNRDNHQTQVWSLSGLVENALWTDISTQISMTRLQEALGHLAAQNISLNEHVRVHGLLALMFMRQGDYVRARQEADTALELMKQSNFMITYNYEGYVAPVDIYLSLWELESERQGSNAKDLSRLARQGLKKSRELGRTYPIFKPRSLVYQGRFDWLSGKQRKAQKAWVKGVDLGFELDMPHEAGLLHLEYGRHLLPGDPERQEHLTRALDLFTNVGAHYFINRTREELNIEQES